jgi:hypothetical protein
MMKKAAKNVNKKDKIYATILNHHGNVNCFFILIRNLFDLFNQLVCFRIFELRLKIKI